MNNFLLSLIFHNKKPTIEKSMNCIIVNRKVMKNLLFLFFLVLTAFQASAQLPTVFVRFNNPLYECITNRYIVDVELKSDIPGQQLFGMNVRLFYDDNILEYAGMSQFETGYSLLGTPAIQNYGAGSGTPFGLAGPAEWLNGSIQLTSSSTFVLTGVYQKIFRIGFYVDDPNALNSDSFCPPLIWDMQADPSQGGYLPGDDGVVITVVDPDPLQESSPANTSVDQHNWEYLSGVPAFGQPIEEQCIPIFCPTPIPLSNWALFLAIGLMLVTTLFIWRKRMNA